MSFNLLAIREIGAAADPLYPDPGEEPNSVVLRPDDGTPSAPLPISELILHEVPDGGGPKRLLRIKDVDAAFRTTESRITIACSKYDKGGGWAPWSAGGIPVALAANAISKARAARRREGKMLVGQILYKSLVSIGYRPRSTPLGHDQLRFGTVDPTATTFRGLLLDLTLPRQHSGAELARLITAHVATRRLASATNLDAALREHLMTLCEPSSLQAQGSQFSSYFLVKLGQAQPQTLARP